MHRKSISGSRIPLPRPSAWFQVPGPREGKIYSNEVVLLLLFYVRFKYCLIQRFHHHSKIFCHLHCFAYLLSLLLYTLEHMSEVSMQSIFLHIKIPKFQCSTLKPLILLLMHYILGKEQKHSVQIKYFCSNLFQPHKRGLGLGLNSRYLAKLNIDKEFVQISICFKLNQLFKKAFRDYHRLLININYFL